MKNNKTALILSYIFIVVDVIVGFIFTPTVIRLVGNNEYGLYKAITAIASYLTVLDLGLGSTITRYVVKFKSSERQDIVGNFVAMGLIIYIVIGIVIFILGSVICLFLPKIYPNTIDSTNIGEARIIMLLLIINTVVALIGHSINGLLVAYQKFVFINCSNIAKLLLRAGIIIGVLTIIKSAIVIAAVDLILTILLFVISCIYEKKAIGLKIKLCCWDKGILKEMFAFTSAVFVQAIISQFNGNVDNILIGAMVSASAVSIYSVSLQLYTMYASCSTAVQGIASPAIMENVFKRNNDRDSVEALIKPSQIQFVVLSAVLIGFICWGKSFIVLWINETYVDAYYVGVLLFSTSFIMLVQNNFVSILKAKNKMYGQTMILCVTTVLNLFLTIILIPRFGIIGAAIGTAVSYLVGNTFGMNLYYKYCLKLNIGVFFKGVLHKIWFPIILSFVIGCVMTKYIPHETWVELIISCLLFLLMYIILILCFGINKADRKLIISRILHRI